MKSNGARTVGATATVGNLQALGAITLSTGSVVGTLRATGALTKDLTASSECVEDPNKQDGRDDGVTGSVLFFTKVGATLVNNAQNALMGL
jgi:hypothetical protein